MTDLWRGRAVLVIRVGGRAGFTSPASGTWRLGRGGRGCRWLGLLLRIFRVILQVILILWPGVFAQRIILVQILFLTAALWSDSQDGQNYRYYADTLLYITLQEKKKKKNRKTSSLHILQQYLRGASRSVVNRGSSSFLVNKQLFPPLPPPAQFLAASLQIRVSSWRSSHTPALLLPIVICCRGHWGIQSLHYKTILLLKSVQSPPWISIKLLLCFKFKHYTKKCWL